MQTNLKDKHVRMQTHVTVITTDRVIESDNVSSVGFHSSPTVIKGSKSCGRVSGLTMDIVLPKMAPQFLHSIKTASLM
jgi:hypothetical protein